MILSFHPCFDGHQNIICAGREADEDDLAAIRKASAVILPQGCRDSLYQMAKNNCPHVFPNYDARFNYPGKLKQIELFSIYAAPYPPTKTFADVGHFLASARAYEDFNFPFVFKFDWGGEGDFVFLIKTKNELDAVIKQAKKYEASGQKGFLFQDFVATNNRSLRVVVINEKFISYWRIHNENQFHSSLSKGATIDHNADIPLQQEGVHQVKSFCKKTRINLAGFDLLFSDHDHDAHPFFIEINYFFGRKGLGGSNAYYQLLETEITSWIKSLNL